MTEGVQELSGINIPQPNCIASASECLSSGIENDFVDPILMFG